MRSTLVLVSAIAVLTVFAVPTSARKIEDWPYDRSFKDSDVVLIAMAEVANPRLRFGL